MSLCQSEAICLSARGSVFTELSSSPAIIELDVFHMLSHWLFLRLSGTKSLPSPGHSGCQINHTNVPAPAKAMQGVYPGARRTTWRAQGSTGPSVTCHACTQFGKPLIHPNLNKLGLARRKHTGKQLHICCACVLLMDPESMRRPCQW